MQPSVTYPESRTKQTRLNIDRTEREQWLNGIHLNLTHLTGRDTLEICIFTY